jgi:sulfur-oxidizing protein SoxA
VSSEQVVARSSPHNVFRQKSQSSENCDRITGPCILAALVAAASIAPAWSAAAGEIPTAERKSGYEFMSHETRAMQDDDAANPGMLWVLDGELLWTRRDGGASKSCADCHGEAGNSMKGVAARYPVFDSRVGRPVDLEERINICRTEQQNATPFPFESREMLALAAFVGRQSRGMPININDDGATKPFIEAGRAIFERRQGQLNLSCAQCHDDNWRGKLAGAPITQGHPTGYPLYRLEWQAMGSLQRRLRNCLIGMRAEPYAVGASEYIDLEMFLMWRARSMAIETPAVRP